MENKKIRKIKVPQMGANEQFAEICEWKFQAGEVVNSGEVVAIMETTKTTFEVESNDEGYIYPIYQKGEEAKIGEEIAIVSKEKSKNILDKYKDEQKNKGREVKLTDPAREYLESVDGDYSKLPTDRILRAKDVKELLDLGDEGADHGISEEKSGDVEPAHPRQRIVIVGAGQAGLTFLEVIRTMSTVKAVGFAETDPAKIGERHGGLPVWPENFDELAKKKDVGAVAIALSERRKRIEVLREAQKAGLYPENIIHNNTSISNTVSIGVGNFVKSGAVIGSKVGVKNVCLIDNGVIIPHHCKIKSGVHIAPGVSMGGGVHIGECTLVGVGSTVSPHVRIGENVIIAPGSVIREDIPDAAVVEGNPAEVIGHTE